MRFLDKLKLSSVLAGQESDAKLVLQDYGDYSHKVANAYMARPKEEGAYAASWAALMKHTERMFKQLQSKYKVEFVDEDPYASYEIMEHEVGKSKILKVWRGASAHPIWTEEQNWKFRAVHDATIHIAGGHPFTLRGELAAYNRHMKIAPPAAYDALFTEVVGQVCTYTAHKSFNFPQKVCKLWGFDYVNVGRINDIAYQKNFPEAKDQNNRLAASYRRIAK